MTELNTWPLRKKMERHKLFAEYLIDGGGKHFWQDQHGWKEVRKAVPASFTPLGRLLAAIHNIVSTGTMAFLDTCQVLLESG